jgi:PEP-CTERM motif
VLTINGEFTQSSTGSLETEIAGVSAGTGYDRLAVTGPATLAGNLDLSLLNNFVPTPYTPFTILTATSITGAFDTITGLDAVNGLAFATIYHSDHVDVIAALIGDLNLDQQVTISDFIDLSSHFNMTDATWRDGDLNGDGAVTISDFIDLASHFGQTYTTPLAILSAVPEPSTLLLFALPLCCLRRRRS